MTTPRTGFTLVEMMVVVVVMAILALMAAPSFQDQIIRDQINKALPLADIAKTPNAVAWTMLQTFPPNNAAASEHSRSSCPARCPTNVPVAVRPCASTCLHRPAQAYGWEGSRVRLL